MPATVPARSVAELAPAEANPNLRSENGAQFHPALGSPSSLEHQAEVTASLPGGAASPGLGCFPTHLAFVDCRSFMMPLLRGRMLPVVSSPAFPTVVIKETLP